MKRPLAVSIVAAFLFAATFIAWLVAAALLHPTQFTEWMFTLNPPAYAAFNALGWMAGVLLFALGCLRQRSDYVAPGGGHGGSR